MSTINNGIVNSGTIGGNASVSVTHYGTGNVVATDSVVHVRQRAERVARTLAADGERAELAAVTAILRQLSQQAAAAAEQRTEEANQMMAAIESLARDVGSGRTQEASTASLVSKVVDTASRLADVAPAAVKLAAQLGSLLAL